MGADLSFVINRRKLYMNTSAEKNEQQRKFTHVIFFSFKFITKQFASRLYNQV